MSTYGFEAEFQTNAAGVIAGLHAQGLAGAPNLHGYHCDCDTCAFGNGHAFRGQSDSSCSGEIISDVMEGNTGTGAPVEAIRALCNIAVDVDAEPGMNSGFHVHVGLPSDPEDDGENDWNLMVDAFWQFVRWEQVLEHVAGGRWAEQRNGMNESVRACQRAMFESQTGRSSISTPNILRFESENERDRVWAVAERLMSRHQGADRHNNLNIQARSHPTWEFRLWNSTRSAWRMELFCGLSVALFDREVVTALATYTPPQRFSSPNTGFVDLAAAVDDGGFGRTAELLLRQGDYLANRAGTAPALLTVL